MCHRSGSSSYIRQISSAGSRLTSEDQKHIDADIIAIVLAIVLQDIPFICLRLTLILK